MHDKQASATATNLALLAAAALLLFAGQPASHSAGLNDAMLTPSGDAAILCHMPVGASESYGQVLSRTLYESEMALIVPYDAPDCAG